MTTPTHPTGSNVAALPIRSIRILHVALIGGIVLFASVAVLAGLGTPDSNLALPLFIGLGALTVGVAVVQPLLRRQFLGSLAARHDAATDELRMGLLPPELASLSIVRAALVEGVGLFGVVVFMLTGQWAALAAPGLAIVLIAACIPTRERAEGLLREARG